MTASSEPRPAANPEFVRDVEAILERRFRDERVRRRKAEKVARWSTIMATASLLFTAVIGYTLFDRRGPGVSAGIIRTRELRLVDSSGRVRGRWTMLRDGGTRLSFLDESGTERMRMTLLQNGAQGITLADRHGQGRVVLSLEGGEGSRLTFADASGVPRTLLGLSPQQAGSLIFADEESQPRAALGLQSDGRAMFVLPESRHAQAADTSVSELAPPQ